MRDTCVLEMGRQGSFMGEVSGQWSKLVHNMGTRRCEELPLCVLGAYTRELRVKQAPDWALLVPCILAEECRFKEEPKWWRAWRELNTTHHSLHKTNHLDLVNAFLYSMQFLSHSVSPGLLPTRLTLATLKRKLKIWKPNLYSFLGWKILCCLPTLMVPWGRDARYKEDWKCPTL